MNPPHENALERAVDRALKNLPELEAPRHLSRNVMAALKNRAATPWYRQPWQAWSLPLQTASLLLLAGAFFGLCYGAVQLTELEGLADLAEEVGRWKGGLLAVLNILGALGQSVILVGKQLGSGVLLGCLAALGISYAVCIGLGTLWLRLAWIKR